MKKVSRPPIVSGLPTRLSDVWFQHESPKRLDFIVPVTYNDLLKKRSTEMDPRAAERYVNDRIVIEDRYRVALGIDNDQQSFTYATVVGFHSMGNPNDYPGFTYFFRLTPAEVSQTLFGTVTNDPMLEATMERGVRGLEQCIMHWDRHSDAFQPVNDPSLGKIDPRIEVIISFPIRPQLFITQIEDREIQRHMTR